MSCYRAQGILAAGLCVGALAACAEPVLNTNLRPEGDPEVLTVLVLTDQPLGFFGLPEELPTFCKANDEKVPVTIVVPDLIVSSMQICPEPGSSDTVETVRNAQPVAPAGSWWVRVVFDELLDTRVEELIDNEDGTFSGTIANTQPFTIRCNNVAVEYDGYYSPNGNSVTYPPGPSLVAYPLDFVPTSATCTVEVRDNVRDKDGNAVPTAQRGPYEFQVAPLRVVSTLPAATTDPLTAIAPDAVLRVTFNSLIDAASVSAGDITLEEADGDAVPFTIAVGGGGARLELTPTGGLTPGETYTLTIPEGATFEDIGGGPLTTAAERSVTFTVSAP